MENEVKTKKKKSIFKRWWFWVIVVIAFFVVISFSGNETENSTQTNTDTHSAQNSQISNVDAADNIEAITYAQVAIEEFYPNAKFSYYFDEDYHVVEQHPRYKIEGQCFPTENSLPEKFCVIFEFTNDDRTEYILEYVKVGDKTLINN